MPADLPAICDIYNDAVLNTTSIWNEQAVDLANRQAWFSARHAQGYPVLVMAAADEQVLGYALATGGPSMAFATPWNTRCTCATTSVATASVRA